MILPSNWLGIQMQTKNTHAISVSYNFNAAVVKNGITVANAL
jgi:hypothetical protein